jgi:hypothetical protein
MGPERVAYCLCPSYRKFVCLQSSMWLFERQTYPHKKLLILEDSGLVKPKQIENITIISTPTRFPLLPAKHNYLLNLIKPQLKPGDAIFVWDDDDIFLEGYIERHMEVLESYPVSKLSSWFSYHNNTLTLRKATKAHIGMAFRAECLDKVLGWPLTNLAFDQFFVMELMRFFPFGDPCQLSLPLFVYRWDMPKGYHCSSFRKGPRDESWYEKIDEKLGPKESTPVDLEPCPDPWLIPIIEATKFMIEQNNKARAFEEYRLQGQESDFRY